MKKIPATIVTGFLGAGKTSLIRHVMENANGRRIALLINEFGDVGVDGAILESCGDEDCIIELPNGCICCTVADDFLPAMEKLLAMERFDHIVIETSGLALPKPLVKAFDWPQIRSRLTVDGVIAVVDGPAVADGRFADDTNAIAAQKADIGIVDHDNPLAEVYEDQLLCADLIILNKTDKMDAEAKTRVKAEIMKEVTRAVQIVEAAHGRVSPDILLGMKAEAESDLVNRPSHHDAEGEHDHDDFESFAIALPEIADIKAFEYRIARAAETHDILRMKGFVRVAGKPMRYLIQAVGNRISGHFDTGQGAGNLVVIGRKGLNHSAIEQLIAETQLASVG